MPAITAFAQKLLLDFTTGAATATAPAGRFVALCWGTPNFTGGSTMNVTFGYTPQTALFLAANSPAGSASNSASMTFGAFSSNCSVLGAVLQDAQGGGNQLWFGTLAAARTPTPGDTLVFAAGALNLTIT